MLATAPINLMEFPDKSILIIKGTVVVPRAKTQITSWEIPGELSYLTLRSAAWTVLILT
jgi:hypothetical protein